MSASRVIKSNCKAMIPTRRLRSAAAPDMEITPDSHRAAMGGLLGGPGIRQVGRLDLLVVTNADGLPELAVLAGDFRELSPHFGASRGGARVARAGRKLVAG